jgi:hypothetical protein
VTVCRHRLCATVVFRRQIIDEDERRRLEGLFAAALRAIAAPELAEDDAGRDVSRAVAADPLATAVGTIPGSVPPGFLPLMGIAHSAFSWDIRLNPRVRQVFAAAFDTPPEDLCVGCDLPFHSPRPDADAVPVATSKCWAHADQNGKVARSCCCWLCVAGV